MKITEVVVRFFPYVGGVEQTVYHLGKHLVLRGHEVTVVCADVAEGPSVVEGIRVTRLPSHMKISHTDLSAGLLSAILETAPDIIHTHIPTSWWAEWAAVASGILRVPMILTYHNDLHGQGFKRVLSALYNRLLLPGILGKSSRIVISHKEYADLSRQLTGYSSKIIPIPWGVDHTFFTPHTFPETGPFTISFLSILDSSHRYKGLDLLLRSLSTMKKNGNIFRLRLGGKGEDSEYYKGLVRSLHLDHDVEFLGYIPQSQLPAFYGSSHLFVLPSTDPRQEGFGLVALEALACGRPILTTSIIGVASDITSHGAGVVIPPGDSKALTEALTDLSARMDLLKEMSLRSRVMVDKGYTWERVAVDYETLFKECLFSQSR